MLRGRRRIDDELFGRIDVLVNNVGGGARGKIWEMSVEAWDSVMKLNLRGMFLNVVTECLA